MSDVVFARVSRDPILLDDSIRAVESDQYGAVVSFSGIVRNHDGGKSVEALGYEAHPTADDVIRRVAEEVAAGFPGVRVAIEHRVGALAVGDLALACAVASAHRSEAFAACARLVDEVKHRVPIWKEQRFADGTSEWVGSLG
jgi:molybdopterin synthase catalytic subunit